MAKHESGPLVVGPAGTVPTVNGNGIEIVSGDLKLDSGSVVGSTQTLTGAGAIDTTSVETILITTGANALTLGVPTIPGLVKVITMRTDGGDGTLASTNIVGQSSGSTSITFNDAGDYLILVSCVEKAKWSVIKEGGVTPA